MSGMKESYSEGMANHAGLGSYAGSRKSAGGTLIEVRAGRVSSREICKRIGVPTMSAKSEGEIECSESLMLQKNPARSKTPSTHGNVMDGKWEIPRSSAKADRVGKSEDAHR